MIERPATGNDVLPAGEEQLAVHDGDLQQAGADLHELPPLRMRLENGEMVVGIQEVSLRDAEVCG